MSKNCTVMHNPPFSYGDCVRTCLEMLSDETDIPHFFGVHPPKEAWNAVKKYLLGKGKNLILFPIEEDPFQYMNENNEDIPYMLIGCTSNGCEHASVYINDDLVNNPSLANHLIVRPLQEGFWVIGIVGGRL